MSSNEEAIEFRELMAPEMYDARIAFARVRDALEGSDPVLKFMVCADVMRSLAAGSSHNRALVTLMAIMLFQDEHPDMAPSTEQHQAHTERE